MVEKLATSIMTFPICHASHDGKTPYVSVCVFLKSYENLKDECARDVRASAGAVITGPFVKWFE